MTTALERSRILLDSIYNAGAHSDGGWNIAMHTFHRDTRCRCCNYLNRPGQVSHRFRRGQYVNEIVFLVLCNGCHNILL